MSDFFNIKNLGKKMFILILLLLFSLSPSHLTAGCGGCGPRKAPEVAQKGLIEVIPRSNYIKGDVLLSCGMCNFNSDDNDCSLAVKVGRYVLPVSGVDIDAHGDSHAKDGYCNVIKKVYVEGKVKKNNFYPDKIDLAKI